MRFMTFPIYYILWIVVVGPFNNAWKLPQKPDAYVRSSYNIAARHLYSWPRNQAPSHPTNNCPQVASNQTNNSQSIRKSWAPRAIRFAVDSGARRTVASSSGNSGASTVTTTFMKAIVGTDLSKIITNNVVRHLSLSSVFAAYGISLEYNNPTSSRCVCPFHNDHNPSLLINEGPGYYYCFTCQASGNAISFIAKKENVSYSQVAHMCDRIVQEKLRMPMGSSNIARSRPSTHSNPIDVIYKKLFPVVLVRTSDSLDYELKQQTSKSYDNVPAHSVPIVRENEIANNRQTIAIDNIAYDIPVEKAKQIMKYASNYFMAHLLFNPDAANVRNYMKNRGISLKTAVEFQLGYAPNFYSKRSARPRMLANLVQQSTQAPYTTKELQWFEKNAVSPSLWPFVAHKSLTSYLQEIPPLRSLTAISLRDCINTGLTKNNTIYSRRNPFVDRFRDRLIVPIRDANRNVVAFGGRVMDQLHDNSQATIAKGNTVSVPMKTIRVAKYVNSPTSAIFQKKSTLFGVDSARQYSWQKNFIITVEGYFDVISLYEAGIKNVVATMGTSVTTQQLLNAASLSPSGTIVLLLDGDEAGQAASERAVCVLQKLFNDQQKKRMTNHQPHSTQPITIRKASMAGIMEFIQKRRIIPKVSSDINNKMLLKDCGDVYEHFHPKDVQQIVDYIVKTSTIACSGSIHREL